MLRKSPIAWAVEQLTRGTTRGVDMLLVVTEPTRVSVDTAHVIQKLAGELDSAQGEGGRQ